MFLLHLFIFLTAGPYLSAALHLDISFFVAALCVYSSFCVCGDSALLLASFISHTQGHLVPFFFFFLNPFTTKTIPVKERQRYIDDGQGERFSW